MGFLSLRVNIGGRRRYCSDLGVEPILFSGQVQPAYICLPSKLRKTFKFGFSVHRPAISTYIKIDVAFCCIVLHYVSMDPNTLYKQTKSLPEKLGLASHRKAIWVLRRKGHTYREIAEIMNKSGVKTDHTAVYRLIMEGNPLLDGVEGRNLIGDVMYESRKGRPLRSFGDGLVIVIKARVQIIPLEDKERVASTWCEAHFRLNAVPNDCWLYKLCKILDIAWDAEDPRHLRGRFGFELKFEGDLMAFVCQRFNLKHEMQQIGKAVHAATKSFEHDKTSLEIWQKMTAERNKKILDTHVMYQGEIEADVLEDYSRWRSKDLEQLQKEFDAIPMP